MGDLLKSKKIIAIVTIVAIAFLIGYIAGEISNSDSKAINKEKSAYELIQEGLNRIESK